MKTQRARIAIIGCGHVGMACAHSLLANHLIRELVLIDESVDRAKGEVLDLQQAVPLGAPVKIMTGSYAEAAASFIVILAVGAPVVFDGSRLDMLAVNVGLVRNCIGKLMAENFKGILLVTTNPVDVLTYVAQRESGLPMGSVIGTGTLIDSERLRSRLGTELKVDARSVHISVIGEHGDSSVAVWSTAQVGGVSLASYPGVHSLPSYDELRDWMRRAGPEVARLKGNTCYAIAACVTRICEAIQRDENSVMVVSAPIRGQYGFHDVSFGTPCVIGRRGIESIIELNLNDDEQRDLEASVNILKNAYSEII
jgi:L-lactate dehydrogenase